MFPPLHAATYAAMFDGPIGEPTDILFITDSAGLALVTTPVPHGLSAGAFVSQSGTTGYNGVKYVSSTPTATTYLTDDPYAADSTGGTWAASTGSAYILGLSPSDWLKADAGAYSDAGTTPATDTDTVRQLNDHSGNARNVTQGTSAKRPTYRTAVQNGLPVIEFDGVDDFLASAVSSRFTDSVTVFVVLKITGGTGERFGFNVRRNSPGAGILNLRVGGGNRVMLLGGTYSYTYPAGFEVVAVTANGTNVELFRNAASQGTVSQTTTGVTADILWLFSEAGIGEYGAGQFGELIVFSSALSAAKRAAVHAYLGRWAVY